MDMLLTLVKGKGLFVRPAGVPKDFTARFLDVMCKFKLLAEEGLPELESDTKEFLAQLPQADVQKLVWMTDVMDSGMFGSMMTMTKTTSMRGIAPVAPRKEDNRVSVVKQRFGVDSWTSEASSTSRNNSKQVEA